ncbi:hypothetical protein ACXIVC_21785 [Vibrio parahaemolyticus]|nr:hypothetical protein [Vibrio alginolyticus]
MKSVDKNVYLQVETVTNVENAAVFLAESAAYLDRLGQEGGILGMTRPKFDAVVAAGGGYDVTLACGEEHRVQMKDYATYSELRTDHLKACIYAIAYVEAFSGSIPDTKEGRFELFSFLFDDKADREAYLTADI